MIVLPGADLAKAASAAAFGSFMHQGQICMTTGRHIVHEDIYEDYVAALAEKAKNLPVGDPKTGTVALGPIIDENQLKRIDSIVQDAVAAGARLAAGGTNDGPFYSPTVLADLDPENTAWKDEIFGPVAPVIKFSTIDEAVELANANEYGLSLGILGDVGMAMHDRRPGGLRQGPHQRTDRLRRGQLPVRRDQELRQRLADRRPPRQHGILHRNPVAHRPPGHRQLPVLSNTAQRCGRPTAASLDSPSRRHPRSHRWNPGAVVVLAGPRNAVKFASVVISGIAD